MVKSATVDRSTAKVSNTTKFYRVLDEGAIIEDKMESVGTIVSLEPERARQYTDSGVGLTEVSAQDVEKMLGGGSEGGA